jgi:uncharacterized protein YlxW (UPF0749 family)
MTDTVEHASRTDEAARQPSGRPDRKTALRVAMAIACAVLGFLLVAQVRATEEVGDRLVAERQEDLARILAELSAQSDRLQSEITDLRITLLDFESSAEREELALRTLQRRYDDLRILTGTVEVEGDGIVFTVTDPHHLVTQDLLVDAVQELRDAGAEAIAVNGIRLVASSAFATRNERLVLDRQPIEPPYRITAIGHPDTISKALAIPGGAIDTLQLSADVTATVEARADLIVPAVTEPHAFVFGVPIAPEDGS